MDSGSGRFVLGMLVGVLIGAAGVALIGGGSVPRAASEPALERGLAGGEARSSTPPSAGAELAAAPAETTRAMATPETSEAAVEVTDAEVTRLLAAVEVDTAEPTSGAGVISGVVLDADGRGVPGVLLRATPARDYKYTRPADTLAGREPTDGSVEESVRSAVERFAKARAGRHDVRSDAGGAFRFTGLPGERWVIAGYKQGHRIVRDGDGRDVRVGTEVEFLASEVVELAVSVLEESGAPATEAVILVQGDDRAARWSLAWSPDKPTLWLPVGSYELTACSADSNGDPDREDNTASQFSESQDVTLSAGASPAAVSFTLLPRRGIHGVVRVPPDGPKGARLRVSVMALAPGQEPNLEVLADSNDFEGVRRDEEFHFLDLDAGRYVVGLTRGWGSPILAHQVLEVTQGIAECELQLPEVDLTHALTVFVSGPQGGHLKGVTFKFQHRSGQGRSSSSMQPLQDRSDAYLLEVPAGSQEVWSTGGKPNDSFQLIATHSRYGSKTLELVPGQEEVTFAFEMPASLLVSVPGYVGSEYVGRVQVSCQPASEEANYYFFGDGPLVGAEGSLELEDLSPGPYIVRLLLNSDASRRFAPWVEVASIELDLVSGENNVTLAIPALHAFRVSYADAKEGASISLSRQGGEQAGFGNTSQAQFDAEGQAHFQGIPAGEYALTMWGAGNRRMEITVPCGDVEFVPMQVNAYRVDITDSGGDLGRVGFQDGDFVIGIEGVEFEGEPETRWDQLQASNSASFTYLVLRAGKRLEVSVQGSQIGGWGSMGGSFVPAQL